MVGTDPESHNSGQRSCRLYIVCTDQRCNYASLLITIVKGRGDLMLFFFIKVLFELAGYRHFTANSNIIDKIL